MPGTTTSRRDALARRARDPCQVLYLRNQITTSGESVLLLDREGESTFEQKAKEGRGAGSGNSLDKKYHAAWR